MRKNVFSLIAAAIFAAALMASPLSPGFADAGQRPLIVGGQQAALGAWPWMAALIDADQGAASQFCGGALISPYWVLTAAHCVKGETPETFDIVLGLVNLDSPEGSYERLDAAQVVIHPGYLDAQGTGDNDIALVRLASPSAQQPMRSLVGLNDEGLIAYEGAMATVTGWGSTRPDGSGGSKLLLQVAVPLAGRRQCEKAFPGYIDDTMVCAGYDQGGKDACSGDSGGPLMVADGLGGWAQVGVVSWGADFCAQAGEYGVYARVPIYRQWIYQYLGQAEAFVTRLYRWFLGREPDSVGLKQKAEALAGGAKSASETAREILGSAEYAGRPLTGPEYVGSLYRGLLDRSPDSAGMADWIGRLDSGDGRDAVLEAFLASAEFKAVCEGHGIRP